MLQVYQAPFSISVDHERKTVVLAVRGTLSMKVGIPTDTKLYMYRMQMVQVCTILCVYNSIVELTQKICIQYLFL